MNYYIEAFCDNVIPLSFNPKSGTFEISWSGEKIKNNIDSYCAALHFFKFAVKEITQDKGEQYLEGVWTIRIYNNKEEIVKEKEVKNEKYI